MEIPLFPLRTVLFPGMALPLQIFEERYKAMTRELLANGGEFGVLLIREGEEVGGGAVPFDVGTTASIERAQEVANGRFLITARGERRFRLLHTLPPRPYPYGEVVFLDEDPNQADDPQVKVLEEHVRELFPRYFRLALSLTDQWARGLRLPERPEDLVNFLAPWLQAEELEKQKLLEAEDLPSRLEQLSNLIDRLFAKTESEATHYRRRKYHGFGARN